MANARRRERPDWEPDDLDPDGPSAADVDRFGEPTIECPHCQKWVYDQSELCPKCGMPLSTRPESKMPAWLILVVIAMLLAMATPFILPLL
jgi:uncharacterized paraquat-inducible protein A